MSLRPITAGDCARIAEVLTEHFHRLGVRIIAGSDACALLDDLGWLGACEPTAPQPETAFAIDRQRSVQAFPKYEQALRIARALLLADDSTATRSKARLMQGRFDRLGSLHKTSQDVLFELEVAGRLAGRGLHCVFAEPDIVLLAGANGRLGFACKRPRSEGAIKTAVRRAAWQIRKNPPGLIVIGVEAILQGDPKTGAPFLFQSPSPDEFYAEVDERAKALADNSASVTSRAFADDSVWGILFCGVVTAWTKVPSAFVYKWAHYVVPNPRLAGSAEALKAIDDLMFGSVRPSQDVAPDLAGSFPQA